MVCGARMCGALCAGVLVGCEHRGRVRARARVGAGVGSCFC